MVNCELTEIEPTVSDTGDIQQILRLNKLRTWDEVRQKSERLNFSVDD